MNILQLRLKSTQDALDKLWMERQKPNSHRDPRFADWHGYAIHRSSRDQQPCACLFVTQKGNHKNKALLETFDVTFAEAWRRQVALGFKVKGKKIKDPDPSEEDRKLVCVPRFRESLTGGPSTSTKPRQAGNLVLASDAILGRGAIGTIGAFLKLNPDDGSKWLLSCNHILVRKLKALNNTLEIRGASEEVLSQTATLGKKLPHSTAGSTQGSFLLDAAVAPVTDGENRYDCSLGLKNTSPVGLEYGVHVKKQGHGTGVTCGRVINNSVRVAVLSGLGLGEKFYDNECLIGSLTDDHHDFVGRGDSGALVVSKDSPAGILFAKTNKFIKTDKDDGAYNPGQLFPDPDLDDVRLPLGLVTPFQVVLDALSMTVRPPGSNHKLEMLKLEHCDTD